MVTKICYFLQGIELLVKYGVNGETPEICRAALRCVANALLLDPRMRQVLADTGYGGKLAEKLKVYHSSALLRRTTHH